MNIKINSLEIDETSFRSVISIEGMLSERNSIAPWEFSRKIELMVAERLVERYLAENADKILSSVNVQSVVNALVIRAADRFGNQKGPV